MIGGIMKVKLDIVTGFLGSGKSVFINNIIKETITKDEKVVVLQLEDGETKISNNFTNVKTFMYSDEIDKLDCYISSIVDEEKCTRIIIEYNGTETFEELQSTLSKTIVRKKCKINDIYFIADANVIKSYILNMGDFIIPSLEKSNLIFINNCLGKEIDKIEEIETLVKNINLSGHILKCDNNDDVGRTIRESNLFSKKRIKKFYMNIRGEKN